MTTEERVIEALVVELKEVFTHQLVPIYTWRFEEQVLNLYDVCDERIMSIEMGETRLDQWEDSTLRDIFEQVFCRLESEGYLTLERVEAPEEESLLETCFIPEEWETAHLDELPIYYHEEDPGLEDYYFE